MSTELIPLSDVERMALAVAKSGLFGLKTPDQALALMIVSQAEGRHPALAARDYEIVQGKPSKKSEAMLRDFMAAGGRVEWHELTDERADATFSHPQGGSFRCTWDMARAQRAGLAGKDMWKKFARPMLRSRCVSEGVRTVYPAAASGMYVPEEVRDFSDEPRPVERVRAAMQATPAGRVLESAVARVVPVVDTDTGEVVGEIDTSESGKTPAEVIDELCREHDADADRVWDWIGSQGHDRETVPAEIVERVRSRLARTPRSAAKEA